MEERFPSIPPPSHDGRWRRLNRRRPLARSPTGPSPMGDFHTVEGILSSRAGTLAIRQARPEDARAIARVHIKSWQQAYRGQLPDSFLEALDASFERRTTLWAEQIDGSYESGRRVLVAERGGSLVGFVNF